MASPSAPSSAFLALVARRRSCRAYRPDPVPREHLEILFEAARLAPSACNRQPWRFAAVTARRTREALLRHGVLPGLSLQWAATAPVIIVLGIQREWRTHRLAPLISGIDYPLLDAGIAGEHLVLQATELGLGTCWIGWIRPGPVRRLVGWPRSIRPVALITVGWPTEPREDRSPRRDTTALVRWIDDPPEP